MNDFWRDGYIVVPQVLTKEQIAKLKLEINSTIDCNSAYVIRQINRQIPAIDRLAYSSSTIEHLKAVSKPYICEVEAGDALIMSPLILHSSLKSSVPPDSVLNTRAVIHLEYSTATLPNNLRWA